VTRHKDPAENPPRSRPSLGSWLRVSKKEFRMQKMRWSQAAVGGLVLLGIAAAPLRAAADPVTDWNVITIGVVNAAAAIRPGPTGILDYAMVHAAIHDAVQAYQHRFQPYVADIPGASGSPVAAVAKAARDVLVNRFPGQTAAIDVKYQQFLSDHTLLPGDAGELTGQQAAINIINRRANDGSFPTNPEVFVGGSAAGQWRPTPPAFAPMAAPWLGSVVPFALNDSATVLPEPPPPSLTSGEYTKAYEEVKLMGARVGSGRTPEQTDLAFFYSGNIVAQMNDMVRDVAVAHLADMGDSARLLALANIAAADTAISAWVNKRQYAVWRPSTAINLGDTDGNPRTDADASWLPLINNPPYPDYTSGANSLSGSMTRVLSHYFGDTLTFDVRTAVPQAIVKTRTYERFSDVADDMVEARILLGIHFRFADTVARRQGRESADWAFSHILKPVE
jgi:hypothetical protein